MPSPPPIPGRYLPSSRPLSEVAPPSAPGEAGPHLWIHIGGTPSPSPPLPLLPLPPRSPRSPRSPSPRSHRSLVRHLQRPPPLGPASSPSFTGSREILPSLSGGRHQGERTAGIPATRTAMEEGRAAALQVLVQTLTLGVALRGQVLHWVRGHHHGVTVGAGGAPEVGMSASDGPPGSTYLVASF